MDIEDHLAYPDSAVKAWVYKHVGRKGDFRQDAEQNIRLAMIEAHKKGWYDHDGGELLTYIWPYLRGIAFHGIDSEWRYGIKDDLDTLQEIAQLQERDRLYLDPLYESPIPGLKTPLESSLTPEEQIRAENLLVDLRDEDREILEASFRHTERQAAALLGIPKSTYRYRLQQARVRALALLKEPE